MHCGVSLFFIFATMRIIVVFILLAFGLRPSADNSQQSTDNRHGFRKRISETETDVGSGDGNGNPTPKSDSVSNIRFHESQIRLADSLYKNYLPQYNFEEVKAAMEFFDSLRLSMDNGDGDGNGYGNIIPTPTPTSASDSAIRLQNPILLCAKAHYYHAVGLTEKDDIVGACEHYLIALEIMEEMMANDKRLRKKDKRLKAKVDNLEDYEKIRFVALIYNRLGRLYNNESFCDLAILKYKKALGYVDLINDNSFKANLLKELANSYQLANNADSALCYYNKSLETNSNLTNKLDVEKSIALILFDKGEKDSAFALIKNNLCKIENYSSKNSYYGVLGEMYYKDKVYDSAIFYLEKSIVSQDYYTKYLSSVKLSAIYDSLGMNDKEAYYNDIVASLSFKKNNKIVEVNRLQNVYDSYKSRQILKERIENKKKTYRIIYLFTIFILFVLALLTLLRYKSKIKHHKLSTSLNEKEKDIIDKDKFITLINLEIKQKENEIKQYSAEIESYKNDVTILKKEIESSKQEISGKEADIEKIKKTLEEKEAELKRLKNNLERNKSINIESYYNSEICKKISGRKESDFTPLTDEELALLLEAADKNLGNITKTLSKKYPRLRKEDMICICLILLNINIGRLYHLLNRNRKTIWERINRIKNIMNINEDQDVFLFIKDVLRM